MSSSSTPATVPELLASLQLGQSTEEFALGDALRSFYGLADGANLAVELADQAVDEVLGVLTSAAEPFAALLTAVFDFVGRLDAKVEGRFEAILASDKAEALGLDLAQFDQYEREIATRASRQVDLAALFDSPGVFWTDFHDWYFPPSCVWRIDRPAELPQCDGCPSPERVAEAHFVEKALNELMRQAIDSADPTDPKAINGPGLDRERLRHHWPEARKRPHGSHCPRSGGWKAQAWARSIEELRAAQRPGTFNDLRRFLALPYWQHRWQLYEVWLLGLVLDVVGLDRVDLVLDEGRWLLPVGSRSEHPVARVVGPVPADIFYQHQDTPPAALFGHTQDRPEILIRTSDGENILVVEAKTGRGLEHTHIQEAVFPLVQWQPAIVLFAAYHPVKSIPSITQSTSGGAEMIVAVTCRPDSGVEPELRSRLQPLIDRLLPRELRIVVCDVSPSMPDTAHLARSLCDSPRGATSVLVAFAKQAALIPTRDLADAEDLQLGHSTDPASTYELISGIVRDRGSASYTQLQLVTDLEVDPAELADLVRRFEEIGLDTQIYTWDTQRVEAVTSTSLDLASKVILVPDPSS